MNKFIPMLSMVAEKLDLPQPAKGRILAEISADLEGRTILSSNLWMSISQVCNAGWTVSLCGPERPGSADSSRSW